MKARSDLAIFANLAPVSVETTPLESGLPSVAAQGMRIYVACPPAAGHARLVQRVAQLADAGFEPVPHIVARGVADRSEMRALLARLRSEGGVQRALIVGGDLAQPVGEFHSARDALETGLFAELGFKAVGFACYPEPHRRIGQSKLTEELLLKLSGAAYQSLDAWLVTQFSFDVAGIIAHLGWLRAQNVRAPISIGLAGPTSLQSLARFARLCGVKASIGFLNALGGRSLRLLSAYDPTEFVSNLTRELACAAETESVGLHIFSFGGMETTVGWLEGIGLLGAPELFEKLRLVCADAGGATGHRDDQITRS